MFAESFVRRFLPLFPPPRRQRASSIVEPARGFRDCGVICGSIVGRRAGRKGRSGELLRSIQERHCDIIKAIPIKPLSPSHHSALLQILKRSLPHATLHLMNDTMKGVSYWMGGLFNPPIGRAAKNLSCCHSAPSRSQTPVV